MNPILRAGYTATGHLAQVAARILRSESTKIGRSFSLRRGAEFRFAAWGSARRDRARALLWMHAPSVGEGLQARPVLEALRAGHPELQLAYTYYSPSAQAFAGSLPVDFVDILPFDTRSAARAALDAIAPTMLVFSKLDVWPFLVEEAHARNVRIALISATLPPRSGRRGWLGTALLRDAYARLDAVGAISGDDAERLVELGCRAAAVEVTGDTRYDQVWERSRRADRDGSLLAPLASPRLTLVAGSTWPSDDARLLPAFLRARAAMPGLRCLLAPHEPNAAAVARLEAWAASARLEVRRLGDPLAHGADVIIVDRVGVLGDLYALADVAYVGGGFHEAGLHSVLEPAAYGAPVSFGPMHENSREAGLLEREGGGASAVDMESLASILSRWAVDAGARLDAGHRARALVERSLGATDRSVALVERLMAGDAR